MQEQKDFSPTIQQHLVLLNLRLNDMVQQLNETVKLILETNASLQKENAELKAKQVKA
ncbi:MAG: hypothetical protein ACQCN5_05860 [Candidatus Bathyarchaeia archaeon]|jgi:hypothetical protein